MGAAIVRQPNGLYARWSGIVDDFTHIDCTYEEMWQVLRGKGCWMSPKGTNEMMNHADDEWTLFYGKVELHNPGYRWERCLGWLKELGKDLPILGEREEGEDG